ncbi:MAG: alpha-L-fucosidase [Prolixibacteraceae bacterium]
MIQKIITVVFLVLMCPGFAHAQIDEHAKKQQLNKNRSEKEVWLQDAGFGMFIHIGVDCQLGIVISHSLVGASEAYVNRYYSELPKTFDPKNFAPEEIASLAKLAGMKYVVFTTKHHSGFCMWDTKTTPLNITNTPYKKDLLHEYVDAVRKVGLKVGFYYSPEDFYFLHTHNQTIRRIHPDPLADDVMKDYLQLIKDQCTELMTDYGKIDLMFFDGEPMEEAKQICWELQPEILITRGALQTPEQNIPGVISDEAWESCITMGSQWQYKPTNETYKSGSKLIELLIETRAKGGALLLNIGPKPDGSIPEAQENNLREMAAWYFINHEAIDSVRPWILTNEGNYWLTQKAATKIVYAFIVSDSTWERGLRKEFFFQSIKATPETKINVLGQSGEVYEYYPDKDVKSNFEQTSNGLKVSCVRAQRIYNDHDWPNAVVIKMDHVEPALIPPKITTVSLEENDNKLFLTGDLLDLGDVNQLKAGFEYRTYKGYVKQFSNTTWHKVSDIDITHTGEFQIETSTLPPGEYEFRTYVKHPKITLTGNILRIKLQ